MATIKINIENYPQQKEEILKKLKEKFYKKNPNETFDENKVEFFYSYCMRIGGNDESNFESYLKSTFGGSYEGSYGRLRHSCDGEYPQELIDVYKPYYENKMNEEFVKRNKEKFLTGILNSVGKKANFTNEKTPAVMNGEEFLNFMFNKQVPIYPTLQELKQVEPKIYQKYLNISDKLVSYMPQSENADEFGFVIHDIEGAYRNDTSIFIVGKDDIDVYELFDEEPDTVYWKFGQDHRSNTKKFHNVQPGTNFKGQDKCYKLTDIEVANLISNKIYLQDVDINRRAKRGITNHGNGLFQINI